MSTPEHINATHYDASSPSGYDGNLSDLQLTLDGATPQREEFVDIASPILLAEGDDGDMGNGEEDVQHKSSYSADDSTPHQQQGDEEKANHIDEEEYVDQEEQDNPAVVFESAEDALQTLIAIATGPIDEPRALMGRAMRELLDRLGVKERPYKVREYRDQPPTTHPSSTLLMLKRRLHDEFRMEKSDQHGIHCDELDEMESQHKARMQELLDEHADAMLALSNKESEMMPLPAAPTAKSIHALQKQLGSDATHQLDAATRRLSTLWKTKYERNCGELIQANEVLMVSRSEFEQLNTLEGRDAGYLETKLGILRDDLESERVKGDSLKQAFLLECRTNGVSPEGFKEAKHLHLGRRQLQAQYGPDGQHQEDDAVMVVPQAPVMVNGEFLLDEDQLEGGRTFSFTPDGCRLPSIREIGQRIAELQNEVAIQSGMSDRLLVSVQELERKLDDAQMSYSRKAGAIASNDQLPYIETLIMNKSKLENDRSARFEGHFATLRHTLSTIEKELSHARDLGATVVALVRLEAEAKKEIRLLDVAHARDTMIHRVSKNVGETSKVDYFNARLHTLACEKRLLEHEFEDAKDRADKASASLEDRFAALGNTASS